MEIKDKIEFFKLEYNAITFESYDEAIIGFDYEKGLFVYDVNKMIETTLKNMNMENSKDHTEALDYLYYNVFPLCSGINMPITFNKIEEIIIN